MIKKILGFDVSSTTIGWSVLEYNEAKKETRFIKTDYMKPTKKGSIIERLADTRNKIKKIIEKVKPDEIAIEDIIMFIKGMSTANTVVTLASFNRMIGLLAFDYLKKEPNLYSVMAIRHGLKLSEVLPKKEEMAELVSKHLDISFPYQNNKKGNPRVENEDMADSVAVALFHTFVLAGKAKDNNHSTYKKFSKKKNKKKS